MDENRYDWVMENLELIGDDLDSCKMNLHFCKVWLSHAESHDVENVLSESAVGLKSKIAELETGIEEAERLLELMTVKTIFQSEKETLR